MMVDNRDTVAGSEQPGILDLLRPVGIYNNQQRSGIRRDQRLLR